MIIRGTTPTITITTDTDLSEASTIYVTFSQDNRKRVEKSISDIRVSESSLLVDLTQEDTLSLDAKKKVEIQVRAKLADGKVLASNVMTTIVDRVLKEGVI